MLSLKYQWRRLGNRSKKNTIRRLPVELYVLVIEQVDRRKDLYKLLFICQAFRFEAEKVLYRHISLEAPTRTSDHQLFQTIISCQRIASHIRSLFIITRCPWQGPENLRVNKYWHLLGQALRGIHNLKRLQLLDQEHRWPFSTSLLFLGCPSQLRTLVLHGVGRRITLDSHFLNLQTELAELDIQGISLPLSRNIFPKLTTVVISHPNLTGFINRPTLRAVYLLYPSPLLPPGPILSHVTSLRLLYTEPLEEFGRTIVQFPCLRFLCILNLLRSSTTASFSFSDNEQVTFVLSKLAHLIALEKLSLLFSFSLPPHEVTWFQEYVFEHFANIQVVQFAFELYSISRPITCVRWPRGAPGQEVVELDEEEWRDKRWH